MPSSTTAIILTLNSQQAGSSSGASTADAAAAVTTYASAADSLLMFQLGHNPTLRQNYISLDVGLTGGIWRQMPSTRNHLQS